MFLFKVSLVFVAAIRGPGTFSAKEAEARFALLALNSSWAVKIILRLDTLEVVKALNLEVVKLEVVFGDLDKFILISVTSKL